MVMKSLFFHPSRGDDMSVSIQQEDFDAGMELLALRRENPKVGAIASFVGLVRDINDGNEVSAMTLEHYPGMTEKSLEEIIDQAKRRWHIFDTKVIHRIGQLRPMDQIVFVAVSSSHRGEAFAACEFIMDYLKTLAPFWKKEQTDQGSHWVDARESDQQAMKRWNPTTPR